MTSPSFTRCGERNKHIMSGGTVTAAEAPAVSRGLWEALAGRPGRRQAGYWQAAREELRQQSPGLVNPLLLP
jgi:hypothetical protein